MFTFFRSSVSVLYFSSLNVKCEWIMYSEMQVSIFNVPLAMFYLACQYFTIVKTWYLLIICSNVCITHTQDQRKSIMKWDSHIINTKINMWNDKIFWRFHYRLSAMVCFFWFSFPFTFFLSFFCATGNIGVSSRQ